MSTNDAPTAPVSVTVTSRFMQDYLATSPFLMPPSDANHRPFVGAFVAPDGSTQVYWSDSDVAPKTLSLSRARPDPTSATGWSVADTVTLQDPDPTAQVPFFFTLYGTDPRLVAWMKDSIQVASLADDGTPGPFQAAGQPDGRWPLGVHWDVHAADLGPDPRYVLEATSVGSDWRLRDLTTFQSIPLNVDSSTTWRQPLYVPGGNREGVCRFLVVQVVQRGGKEVAHLVSVTATLRQDGSSFDIVTEMLMAVDEDEVVGHYACLTAHGPGRIQAIGIVQDYTVQTQIGTFDPAGTAPVAWQGSVSRLLGPGDAKYSFARYIKAKGDESSDAIELFWQGGDGVLWGTARPTGTLDWLPLSPIDAVNIAGPLLPTRETTFLAGRSMRGGGEFEVWRRNAQGDFDVDIVELADSTEAPTEVDGFRVGITLASPDLPQGGQTLRVTSSDPVRCTVNGFRTVLRSTKPTAFLTDATGTVWLTLQLQDRLSVPTLYIASDAFVGTMKVTPDSTVQTHLTNVTADQLRAASDPRTNPATPLLPNPGNADAAAQSINAAMKAVNAMRGVRAPASTAHAGVRLTTDCDVRWLTPGVAAQHRFAEEALSGVDAWCLDMTSGTPVFTTLTREEAATMRTAMHAAHAALPRPLNWLDDLWGEIEDIARSVWDGIVKVVTIVVDGAQVVLSLVIDGVTYVYKGVVDTIERAMDVVVFVLDAVGAEVGTAVGWLLSQLGFLFDWAALKAKRDELKGRFRQGLRGLAAALPDPAVTAQNFAAGIGSAKAEFDTWLGQYRSSPGSQKTIGSQTSLSSSAILKLMSGSTSGSAEITWLIEKAQAAFPRLTGGLGSPNIAGLGTASAGLITALTAVGGSLTPGADDAATLFQSWILDQNLFTSSTFDPVLTIFQNHVDQLLDAAGNVVTAGGAVLHLLWSNPDAIADWLDAEISVPYFSGFYRGLTGNALSFLDLVCLAAAVPAMALPDSRAAAADGDRDGWRKAGLAFAIIGSVTTGIAAGLAAATIGVAEGKLLGAAQGFAALDFICQAAWIGCTVVEEGDEVVVGFVGAMALGVACALYGLMTPQAQNALKANLSLLGSGFMALYCVARGVLANTSSFNTYWYYCIGVVQSLMDVCLKMRGTPLPPLASAAYGVAQGGFSGLRVWIYYDQPFGQRAGLDGPRLVAAE